MAIMPENQDELGLMLCKRAGLDPNKVKQEWTARHTPDVKGAEGNVIVHLTVIETVPKSEFEALMAAAARGEKA